MGKKHLSNYCITVASTIILLYTLMLLRSKAFIEMIESIPMIQLLSAGMSRLTLWLRQHHCWSRITGSQATTDPQTCVADVAKRCSLQKRSWEEVVWVFFWNNSVCVIKTSVCIHFVAFKKNLFYLINLFVL